MQRGRISRHLHVTKPPCTIDYLSTSKRPGFCSVARHERESHQGHPAEGLDRGVEHEGRRQPPRDHQGGDRENRGGDQDAGRIDRRGRQESAILGLRADLGVHERHLQVQNTRGRSGELCALPEYYSRNRGVHQERPILGVAARLISERAAHKYT